MTYDEMQCLFVTLAVAGHRLNVIAAVSSDDAWSVLLCDRYQERLYRATTDGLEPRPWSDLTAVHNVLPAPVRGVMTWSQVACALDRIATRPTRWRPVCILRAHNDGYALAVARDGSPSRPIVVAAFSQLLRILDRRVTPRLRPRRVSYA